MIHIGSGTVIQKMKNDQMQGMKIGLQIKKTACIFAMLLAMAVLFTACFPKSYSDEKKKQVEKACTAEAKSWFEENLPEAKMNKKTEAVTSSINLYSAVRGTYKQDGEEYPFLYDHANAQMYLGKDCAQTLDLVFEELEERLQMDDYRLDITYTGIRIETALENDKDEQFETALTDEMTDVLPAGLSVEDCAKMLLCGQDGQTHFIIYAYPDEIPAYDHGLFETCPGIDYVRFTKPVDLTYDGIYEGMYFANKAQRSFLHVKELPDGLYGGFYYSTTDTYDDNGEILEEEQDLEEEIERAGDAFRVEENQELGLVFKIPPESHPIVFAPAAKYVCEQAAGNPSENWQELYKTPSENYPEKMSCYDNTFFLPQNDLEAYTISTVTFENGEYNLKPSKTSEKKGD